MKQRTVDKINKGELGVEALADFVISFAIRMKKDVFQRFFREETDSSDKKFSEYVLIELVRAVFSLPPVFFYIYLKDSRKFREALGLEELKSLEAYNEFDRKRKHLKFHLRRIMKRNLKTKEGDIYILDLTIARSDVNKLRKGKAVKEGLMDAEFIHSVTRGTVVGFQAAYLVNLSKLSFEKLEFYSKHAEKKRIWREMVVEELGTKQGKIKVVIADAGFFAYVNYLDSVRMRLVPVIKPRSNCEESLMEKLDNCDSNLVWFGRKYRKKLEELLDQFREIIQITMDRVKNYGDYKGLRSEIEQIFKAAKMIFGMDGIHVYYRGHGYWKAFLMLYLSSLFCQFLDINGINKNRAIPLLAQNRGIT